MTLQESAADLVQLSSGDPLASVLEHGIADSADNRSDLAQAFKILRASDCQLSFSHSSSAKARKPFGYAASALVKQRILAPQSHLR
jgi:hypothetical protein